MKKKSSKFAEAFDHFSKRITQVTGRPYTFLTALIVVVLWALTGPVFGYSDTWQLVINTGTTIITFLMVFVIQQSQNKDTMALHLKLNELIAATQGASNRLIDIEDLTEQELITLKKFYVKLSKLAEKDTTIQETHSVEEAATIHETKKKTTRKTR